MNTDQRRPYGRQPWAMFAEETFREMDETRQVALVERFARTLEGLDRDQAIAAVVDILHAMDLARARDAGLPDSVKATG